MRDKVLFVDDEVHVLDGFQRLLRQEYAVSTALGGYQGIATVQANGPYAVVVSDMRMPGMNGAEFLAQVRQKAPDSVRILLTGHADLDSAINAINRGNIFQFLTKPCTKAVLVDALDRAVAQYRANLVSRDLAKKAELIARSNAEWDAADLTQGETFAGRAGLPGSSEAQTYLQSRCGVDAHCLVVLIKLTLLPTVESRYGDKAAESYLTAALQFLAQRLRPEDRIFHWRRDVLMAVLRRLVAPAAVRMEISRALADTPQYVDEIGGRKTLIAVSMTFDLLPAVQFPTLDEMIQAFEAKLVGQV